MRTKTIFTLPLILLLLLPVAAQKQAKPVFKPKHLTSREIAEKVLPSVVLIVTQDENGSPISQGSGFVYQPGLVVSNLHVFERATNAIVKNVKTGEISKAVEVVAMNARQDLCVVRIDNQHFPILKVGDSHSIRTGDEIYVASNPKGLEGSFTKGIVSAVREQDRIYRQDGEAVNLAKSISGHTDRTLIQVDAAISPGSSGGAVLNANGEAVGIIKSSLISGQNLNFAIPIEQLNNLEKKFKHPIELAGACAYRDRDSERLKGPVKKVIEKAPNRRVVDGRLIETDPMPTQVLVFDVDGNKIESTVFQVGDNFGKLAWKDTVEYDENRLKVVMTREYVGGTKQETPFSQADAIYNKLINKKFSGTMGTLGKPGGLQVFDSFGNMVTWYIEDTKQTYQYDGDGRALEKVQWRNGKVQIRTRYRYKDDPYGNWIERREMVNYPNNADQIPPDEWIEGDTDYREITYYD